MQSQRKLTINPRISLSFLLFSGVVMPKIQFQLQCRGAVTLRWECLELWKAYDAAHATNGRFYNPRQLNETPLEPLKIAQSP